MKSDSPLASQPPPDPAVLATWLKGRGARRHRGIQPSLATDGSGWGVWSHEDIARGEILCAIPRQSILSARTSSLQKPYQPESAADIILHLTACLLHELRLGEESEWYGWLQMIPRETVLLPTLWSEESVGGEDGRKAMEWLAGTEAEKQLQRKDGEGLSLEELRAYHSTLDLPSTSAHPDHSSFPTFLYAYSMVSSRGFALDTYHLIGLIPFCDMFNHSSSSPHTSLSVDSNVCETCGSLLRCEHDSPDTDRLEHLSAEYLAKLEADGMADMVDMRVQRNIRSREQVFSCYDEEHADAELMVEYGFIEGRNTSITWNHRQFLNPEYPESIQRFMSLLERTPEPELEDGYDLTPLVGPPGEQPEPLVLRPNGEISRSLLTILFNSIADVDHSFEHSGELYDRVLRSLKYRRREDSSPQTLRIVNEVCKRVEDRLATFHRHTQPTQDLEDYVDSLQGDEHVCQRLAAAYMLSERKHLEDCYRRWRPVAKLHRGPVSTHLPPSP